MAQYLGLRGALVFENVTQGELARTPAVVLEVTAVTATKIYINDNPSEGYNAQGIPIPANSTRIIPLQTYWFKADDAVTVVAYRA